MMKILRTHAVATSLLLLVLLFAFTAAAQTAPEAQPDITKVPAAAQPSDHFDVDAATDAYLALMPATRQGALRRLLRRRLLADSVGLPDGRRDRAAAAEPGLVGVRCATWRNASRAGSGCRPLSTGSSTCC